MAAPAIPVKRIIPISFSLTDPQRKYLEAQYPLTTFSSTPGAVQHSHPVAALERRLAEEAVFLAAERGRSRTDWVLDIGGNPVRHFQARRARIHSCCPILTPEDAVRDNKRQVFQATVAVRPINYCNDLAANCRCITPATHWCSIMIHSIYYFTPQEICDLVHQSKSKRLFSVHHLFPDPFGTLCNGECQYEAQGLNVVFQTTGNLTPYYHPNPSWLADGYFNNGVTAMSWSRESSFGDSHIYQFTAAPANMALGPAVSVPDIFTSLSMPSYYGAVDLRPLTSVTEGVKKLVPIVDLYVVNTPVVVSMNNHILMTFPGETTLYLPKDALAETIVKISGKPRTPDTLAICNDNAKKILSKTNLPATMIARILPHFVFIAFTKTIEDETKYALALAHQQTKLATLNSLKHIFVAVPTRFKPWMLMIIGVLIPLVAKLMLSIRNWRLSRLSRLSLLSWMPRWLTGWVVTIMNPIITAIWANRYKQHRRALENHRALQLEKAIKLFDVCPIDTPIKPQAAATYVNPFGEVKCNPRVIALGLAVAPSNMPVQSTHCIHAEEVAVRNRVTAVCPYDRNPEQVEAFWKFAKLAFLWDPLHWFYPPDGPKLYTLSGEFAPVKAVPFEQWVRRFPKPAQDKFRKAKSAVSTNFDKPDNLAKAFIKTEFYPKSDEEGIMEFSPRLIQGRLEEYQVDTGPWTLAFSKRLQSLWNWESPVYYVAGSNGKEIGHWFESNIEDIQSAMPGILIVFIDIDASNWDMCTSPPALHFSIDDVYRQVGVSGRAQQALRAQLNTRGVTPHGVNYKAKGKRKSGDGDTSGGNSLLNGVINSIIRDLAWYRYLANISPFACPLHDLFLAILDNPARAAGLTIKITARPKNKIPIVDNFEDTPWFYISAPGGFSYCCNCHEHTTKQVGEDPTLLMSMAVLGDDNANIGPEPMMKEVAVLAPKVYAAAGYVPKLNYRTELYEAEFCSGLFWPSSGGVILGPKIGRILYKTFYYKMRSPVIPQDETVLKHLKGVCLGLVPDVGHIPVLRVLVNTILKIIPQTIEVKPIIENYKFHSPKVFETVPTTWLMAEHVYQVDKTQLESAESFISTQSSLPLDLAHPVLDRIVKIDAGPKWEALSQTLVASVGGPHARKSPNHLLSFLHSASAVATIIQSFIDSTPKPGSDPDRDSYFAAVHSLSEPKNFDFAVLIGDITVSGLVVPVAEETTKRIEMFGIRPFVWLYGLTEDLGALLSGGLPYHTVAHFTLSRLPIDLAIMLHGLWNIACVITEFCQPRITATRHPKGLKSLRGLLDLLVSILLPGLKRGSRRH